MEIHSPVVAKRLWNVLRITFIMIRKGLVSKTKLMMDMNFMTNRGRLLRKSFTNFMSQQHHHSHSHSNSNSAGKSTRGGFGIQEYYEFSCSNSPINCNPVFSHVPKHNKHNCYYFPCINHRQAAEMEDEDPDDHEPKAVAFVHKTPDYPFNLRFDHDQKPSPMLSLFAVRISNYSSEENEIDNNNNNSNNNAAAATSGLRVDDEAEEFIRKFYKQLRLQSHAQLLQ